MQIKIRISKILFERLNSPDPIDSAYLYGYKTSTSVTLTAATLKSDAETELLLPAGLELLGRYSPDQGIGKQDEVTLTRQNGDLVCYQGEDRVDFEVVDTRGDVATLRVKTNLLVEVSSSAEETESHWEKLHAKVHSEFATFHLAASKVVLLASDSKSTLSGAPQDITVEELTSHVADEEEGKTSRKSRNNRENPLDFKLYWSSKIDETVVGMQTSAPVFYHQRKSNKTVNLSLPIDVVAIIPWDNLAEDIGNLLAQAICKQLQQMRNYFVAELKEKSPVDVDIPKSVIFMPDTLGHYVSLVFPAAANEDLLIERRIALHELFFLKLDRPVFKLSLKHWFPEDYRRNRYLINVHQGLHHPNSGETAIVQGRYAYHHYLQDNAEDNGWGCAYRSLQTIVSWFRLQGYTDKPVPTHKEIQQCLVDIGDKPASFVGSRQWIGSMEVSFCLQSLIGVESSILNVSSGAELASKGRQIAQHFRTHGTPVMIGGGVLAHTILGIDFNEETGDAKFLILDPHYTGGEDLNVIQNKGWCGWKPATFWDSSAFYNLCMPHRPHMY